MTAFTLADLLTTAVIEDLCSRERITLGGVDYRPLEAHEYAARGYSAASREVLLLQCATGGEVFEVRPHMDAEAACDLPPLPGTRREATA